MKTPLRVLHLEDDPNEATIVRSMLEAEAAPCRVTHVQQSGDFAEALERGDIDLIISDYSLPGFDGMTALKMTRAKWPDMPFILLSGTVGEEFAIESLKSGATDYVLKDRRSRLIPALRRAMQEVEERAERRRIEEQFLQAQKMEVVGRLSSGVAHDFNNILGIIIGNNDYMMTKLPPDDPLRQNAEEIQNAAARAAGVTRQLLVFSRNQAVQLVVLDINEVIQEMDKMLCRLVEEHIELKIVLGEHIGRVKADSGYLGQLLMNLVINARDAMPDGGKLVIETSNIVLDKNNARTHPDIPSGNYVMLSVADTGMGMTDEVKKHIFEAFFTTKPKGKGTGLGLATCQTIVKQSHAFIDVESESAKGATFKIYFPQVDKPLHTMTRPLPLVTPPRGTETLLIVEDEGALRRMISMVLENLGYTVLQASSGQAGLNVANEHKGPPISLVITDLMMPQMGGKAMADLLKTTYPQMKVLFTSGYTDTNMMNPGMPDPDISFLPKPYTLAILAAKIREMLQ